VAIDPVSKKAFRTPMFIAGALMLVTGLIPVAVAVISGWSKISGVSFLSAFAPIGVVLMAVARSRASQEWKQGR
jgi:hypothetical protein